MNLQEGSPELSVHAFETFTAGEAEKHTGGLLRQYRAVAVTELTLKLLTVTDSDALQTFRDRRCSPFFGLN